MAIFSHIVDAAKKHPAVLLGGTAAIIVIIALRSGGKSSSAGATGVYAMMSDPTAVAANTQLVLAQDQLSANGATLAAQVQMNADNNAAALANATIQGNVSSHYIDVSRDVTNNQTSATVAISQGQTSAAQAVALAQTAAGVTVNAQNNATSQASIAANLQSNVLANQTQQLNDQLTATNNLKIASFSALSSLASSMPDNVTVVNNAVTSLVPNTGGSFWNGFAADSAYTNMLARGYNNS